MPYWLMEACRGEFVLLLIFILLRPLFRWNPK